MLAQFERGGMIITPLTLHAAMKADPGLVEVGGHSYLAGLAQAAPALPNVRDYARILHDLAVRRALIHIGEDIVNTAYEAPHDNPPKAQIETAEKALYSISESSRYGEGAIDFAESLRRAVEIAEKAAARGGRISGVTTGFDEVDRLLGGLQPSDLLILAGRPGMGKTSLATNMSFHAARAWLDDMAAGAEVPRGAPVLFFSLEMAAQQLSGRILSEQSEIEMWKIRNGRFSENEWEKFVLTTQDLSTLPLFIDDTGGISIAQMAARARRMKREKNIGLIVIDYLQLLTSARSRRKPRAGDHRDHDGPQGVGQGTERADPGTVAALALGGIARRQAAHAVRPSRIRLDRAGRRRRHVRVSRGVLSEVPRAGARHP